MSSLATSPIRSRYVDALRVVAIARVCLNHTLRIGWLTVLFPSMPVMFALAGCLTAASLQGAGTVHTLRSRLRRLLPPLWTLAAVAIPLMLLNGWLSDPDSPWRPAELIYWIFPLSNPPASTWGGPFALALWYLRAYLWFILLSPVLWWLFHRWPIATLTTPLLAAIVLYSPLIMLPVDRIGDTIWTTAAFGTCWIIGYARHTRLLDRLPVRFYLAAGAAIALTGAGWGWMRQTSPEVTWMFADPLAELLWGTGYTLILMRLRPTLAWLDRTPRLARLVAAVNARAITIYLWHLPAFHATGTMLSAAGIDIAQPTGILAIVAVCVVLMTAILATVGWIEDLAAHPPFIPAHGHRGNRQRATVQSAASQLSQATSTDISQS